MTDITVPEDLWDTDDEAVIFSRVYADSGVVEQGKLVAELTVEKAQRELNAPASGRLTNLPRQKLRFAGQPSAARSSPCRVLA